MSSAGLLLSTLAALHVSLLLITLTQANDSPSIKLPSFFSDHMVLQREEASLWGWAGAANTTSVIVMVSDESGRTLTEVTGSTDPETGRFQVSLRVKEQPNTTVTLIAPESPPVVLSNVAFGDVFICSGEHRALQRSTGDLTPPTS